MARHLRWALGSGRQGHVLLTLTRSKLTASQVQQYNNCVRHIVNVMNNSAAAEGMRDWYRSLLTP